MSEHLIILPTADLVDDFRKNVQRMTNHDYDYGEIIKDVFSILAYAPDAIANNRRNCEIIIDNFDRVGARDDGIVLANAIGTLVNAIREIFIDIDAWDSNRVLRLKYLKSLNDDWIVQVDHRYAFKVSVNYGNPVTTTVTLNGADILYGETIQPPEDGSS